MANNKLTKRTFRCSDAEWEKITQSAKKMDLSASRFIVEKVCSDGLADENNITRILSCSRLLAFDLMDRLRAEHSEDDYNLLLARTKYEHIPLDEFKKAIDELKKKQTESTQQHD